MEDTLEKKFLIQHLKKSYKKIDPSPNGEKKSNLVLKIQDLALYQGKFITILGISGAGKSTFLNLLGRLDYPDQEDQNTILYYSPEEKEVPYSQISSLFSSDHEFRERHFGYVFQRCYELKHFSSLANIALPLAIRGVEKENRSEVAHQLMAGLGINDLEKISAGKLSGGEISRLSILRGISHNPDVVFADEPTNSLDPQTGLMVMQLLKDWKDLQEEKKQPRTVIMVTHNLEQAFLYADQIIVLRKGEVVFNELQPKDSWKGKEEEIRSYLKVEKPEKSEMTQKKVDFPQGFSKWGHWQRFVWEFAWKDLFPSFSLKGIAPVFLGILSLFFLLFMGLLFSDLKQIGQLKSVLLLQNPFLLKIDTSETTKGFIPPLIQRVESIRKTDLTDFLKQKEKKLQNDYEKNEDKKTERQRQAIQEEIEEVREFQALLKNTKEYEQLSHVFPFSPTSAHFKMKNGRDAPARYDGRTLVNWKDPIIRKLTYLTPKPQFQSWEEKGLIISEDLVRKLGHEVQDQLALVYKYSAPDQSVQIPVLSIVKDLPGEIEYLVIGSLQSELLGNCFFNEQRYQSVRVGPIDSDDIPEEWKILAQEEKIEIFPETLIGKGSVEERWLRWRVEESSESMSGKFWNSFLEPYLQKGMEVRELEVFVPPCDNLPIFFGWSSIYAKEQGYVPALEVFLQEEGLPEEQIYVLSSEREAIMIANSFADFFDTGFLIIISAVSLLGITSIFSTFSGSIERKSPEIGVIQALGGSPWKIAHLFIIETLILFSIPAVLSLIVDLFFMNWLLEYPDFKKVIFPQNVEAEMITVLLRELNFWIGRSYVLFGGVFFSICTTISIVFLFLRRPIAEAVKEN